MGQGGGQRGLKLPGARLELWLDLAAPSRWLWVQGGQEPPQELEGSHSPAAASPRYLPTSPSQSPVSITALTLDGGLCWPAAQGPCVVPSSPRAPLPPEAEPRGALAAQSTWERGLVQIGVGWFWGVCPGVQQGSAWGLDWVPFPTSTTSLGWVRP